MALVALVYVEAYVVGLVALRQFVASYEFGIAIRGLTPIAFVAAAPCAVVTGGVVELLRRGGAWRARVAIATFAATFAGAVGYGVAGGRMFQNGGRVPFSLALSLVAALAALALAPRLARLLVPPRGLLRGLGYLAVAVGLVVALEVANLRILPRLYPAFHLALGGLTLLVAAAGGLSFGALDLTPRRAPISADPASPFGLPPASGLRSIFTGTLVRAIVAAAVFAMGAARAPGAGKLLTRRDNVRLIYHERAPLLRHVVALASQLSPPDPPEDAEIVAPQRSGHAIQLTGRDFLLVTVDALRADHVGAYGYGRPTTPNIDRLASDGVVFNAAYSPTPHTSYAVTSLMTGKYMRPLILQGLGDDSETWAGLLRRYGYRTAAFYPPAIFFIDSERFTGFRDRALDFEYRRIEFAPAEARAVAVQAYLEKQPRDQRVFVWVHLFEPHEPYEAHAAHPFGDRDVDRYDSEIAAADDGIGAIVAVTRALRPNTVVIVTADHGEEFSEHGGRYHGTTVYEEQVRVPLVVNAPGLFPPHHVQPPAQLVDLLPTVLAGLQIPRPARVRGTDQGPALVGVTAFPDASPSPGPRLDGFAFAETDAQTVLARGALRLLCARKIGACALYDLDRDPGQQADASSARPSELSAMRAELRAVEASHGRYERQGLHREGKGWPEALRRGLAGDGDAAEGVGALLDDADVVIRRKAAEVLFELGRTDASAQLRLALVRDEDDEVRRWSALALTRLGEGAPRVRDMLTDPDLRFRRLAALALAEQGDTRGEEILVAWFREAWPAKPEATSDNPSPKRPTPVPIPFERAREIVSALGKVRAKSALGAMLSALADVRLRPYLARALAAIGEEAARPALAEQLRSERYQVARVALTEALVKLGGGPELRAPLVRFLGTPDPLPEGLRFALEAKILDLVGGPRNSDRDRLRRFATSGVAVGMVVPKLGKGEGSRGELLMNSATPGLRVICRARSTDRHAGEIRVGLRLGPPPAKMDRLSFVPSAAPAVDPRTTSVLSVPAVDAMVEAFATLPNAVKVKPGEYGDFVVYATQNVQVVACAVVPLAQEVPPPPPEPWTPVEEGK